MPKKFYCTPIGTAIPIGFLGVALFFGLFFVCEILSGFRYSLSEILCWLGVIFIVLFSSILSARIMCRYVLLYSDRIVCRGIFSREIVMDYAKCHVGVDHGNHRNGRTWWIYLSYAPYPPFKKDAYYNRINAQYCKEGFIRIMYNKEVYKALMEVLPKQQRTALGASYSLHLARYDK